MGRLTFYGQFKGGVFDLVLQLLGRAAGQKLAVMDDEHMVADFLYLGEDM
jgi:hypothetical protein